MASWFMDDGGNRTEPDIPLVAQDKYFRKWAWGSWYRERCSNLIDFSSIPEVVKWQGIARVLEGMNDSQLIPIPDDMFEYVNEPYWGGDRPLMRWGLGYSMSPGWFERGWWENYEEGSADFDLWLNGRIEYWFDGISYGSNGFHYALVNVMRENVMFYSCHRLQLEILNGIDNRGRPRKE